MIPKDPPVAGTVLRYSYLWRREAEQGRDEGVKDRPVALLLSRGPEEGSCIVLPITHSAPDDPQNAVELPDAERARLGLDAERCWIVLTELNVFAWPGPDLRPIPGREPATIVYGTLSRTLFRKVLDRVQALVRARGVRPVDRTP